MHWSPHCMNTCFHNTMPPPCLTTSVESPVTTVPLTIPHEYLDLREVFNKDKAVSLPLHRPWDCSIDLLPHAMLPKKRVYPLSLAEMKAMDEYIEEALASDSRPPLWLLDSSSCRKRMAGSVHVSITGA